MVYRESSNQLLSSEILDTVDLRWINGSNELVESVDEPWVDDKWIALLRSTWVSLLMRQKTKESWRCRFPGKP